MAPEDNVKNSKLWTSEEVRALTREIVFDLAPVRSEPLPEARLVEDLGYHSLSLLEMAFSLEDEFGLPAIDETTARQILTVGCVERYVLTTLHSCGRCQ